MEAVLRAASDLAPIFAPYIEEYLRSRLERGVVKVLTYFTVFLYNAVEEREADDFVRVVVERLSCSESVRDPLIDKVGGRYVCVGRTSFGLLVEKTTLESMILGEEVFQRLLSYIEDEAYEEKAEAVRFREVAEELGIHHNVLDLVKELTIIIYARNPRAEDLANLVRTLYDEAARALPVENRVVKVKVFADKRLRAKIVQDIEKRFDNRVKVYSGEELVIVPRESIAVDVEFYRSVLGQHTVLGAINKILGKH